MLKGGNGIDTASYATSTFGVVANLSGTSGNTGEAQGDVYISVENLVGTNTSDTLVGDGNSNTLSGLLGSDNIQGRGGNDELLGGTGNDQLEGGDGADVLNGDDDFDYAKYAYASGPVTADLQGDVLDSGDAAGDSFISIEGLIGSAGNDTLYGDGGANDLAGAAGQ